MFHYSFDGEALPREALTGSHILFSDDVNEVLMVRVT